MTEFFNLLVPWWGPINWITDSFISAIVLYTIVSGAWFWVKIGRRRGLIDRLTEEASKYTRPAQLQIKQQLKEKFPSKNEIAEAWQEFEDSLISDDNREVIYKTDEASLFFSEDRLLGQYINLRFWNSVPATLVGLGILGTFVGLVWGLIPFSGINFEETSQIQEGIKKLLSGVSTAFVTSVWGMLTSLLFSGLEKWCIGSVSRAIANLQRALDRLFTLTTQEEISFRQEDELAQQTQALKSFSTDLANDIKSAMADGRQVLIQELHSATKAFSSAITEQLEPTFNNLNTALEELRRQKEESSTDAIQQLVEEFQKSLSGSATAQMETLAETVNKASESLITLPEQLGGMMVGVQEQVNQTRQLLSKTSQDQTEQMKSMMDGMLSAFQNAIDTHQAGLSATTGSVNEEMKQIANNIRNLLESTADHTDAQLAQRMADMEKVSAQSVQALQTTIEKLQESMTSTASQTTKNSEAMTNQMHQLVDQSASRLESIFQTGEVSVSELLKQQADQIKEVNAQMDTSREILEKSREMLKQMEAGVTSAHKLVETTRSLSDQLVTGANTLEDAGERLMEASDAFSEETAEYLKANRETTEQIQNMQIQSRQLLNDFSTRFETIDAGLKSIFEEIEEGLTGYSTTARDSINMYLNQFSEQLTQASAKLAGSVEALEEIVEELIDMIDRLK